MEIVDIDEKLNSELLEYFKGEEDGYVQVGENKWFLRKKFRKLAEQYKNFEVKPDDIWITGYLRSGTTLTQEITWLLAHNLDFVEAKEIPVYQRILFLEGVIETKGNKEASDVPAASRFEQIGKYVGKRRIIKTHLPFELLPKDVINKGCKIIYVCRNPKDACVSHYFFQSSSRFLTYCGDFKKYWELFKNGHILFGPYFQHVRQGFERIGSDNFKFVFYEEFKKDQKSYIKELSEFINTPISDDQLETLAHYIDFDNFKKVAKIPMENKNNEKVSHVRKGQVGGWREHFTEEMAKEADEWIDMNSKRIGIEFVRQEE